MRISMAMLVPAIVAVLTSAPASARARSGWRLGITRAELGGDWASLGIDEDGTGLSFGVYREQRLNRSADLHLGLSYLQWVSGSSNATLTTSWLEAPLLVRTRNAGINAYAGVNLALNMEASGDADNALAQLFIDGVADNVEDLCAGAVLGIELELETSRRPAFVDIRYAIGLTDIDSSDGGESTVDVISIAFAMEF